MGVEILDANHMVTRQGEKLGGTAIEMSNGPNSLVRRRPRKYVQETSDTSNCSLGGAGGHRRHGDVM